MRNLIRDTQTVYIARFEGLERVVDEQGRLTGRNEPKRSEPIEFHPSVTMAAGTAKGAYFGLDIDYDRVLTLADPTFDVKEADILWIDENDTTKPHDHVVKRVSRKSNFTVIGASRVEVSA